VNQPVKLVINSRDVIHDVGLVYFRQKMDAVPGTPTTMWFVPKFTTDEMKKKLGAVVLLSLLYAQGLLGVAAVAAVLMKEPAKQHVAAQSASIEGLVAVQ